MTHALYSTSAAAHILGITRGKVQRIAEEADLGRGAGGSLEVHWLFTRSEIEQMRRKLGPNRSQCDPTR